MGECAAKTNGNSNVPKYWKISILFFVFLTVATKLKTKQNWTKKGFPTSDNCVLTPLPTLSSPLFHLRSLFGQHSKNQFFRNLKQKKKWWKTAKQKTRLILVLIHFHLRFAAKRKLTIIFAKWKWPNLEALGSVKSRVFWKQISIPTCYKHEDCCWEVNFKQSSGLQPLLL